MTDDEMLDSIFPDERKYGVGSPQPEESFEDYYRRIYAIDEGDDEVSGLKDGKIPESILWQDLEQKIFQQQAWRIKDLIPKQGFVVLASISGEKKTWLALEMAKSIAAGQNFLNESRFKTEGANVLYINGENAESEMQRRGRQLNFDQQSKAFKLFISSTDNLNLNKDDGAIWLKSYIQYYKIEVVFIDTFIATAGGLKEDKSDEVRQFFNKFNALKNLGVVIIWLMHMRKPTNFEGRIPKKEQLLGSQDKTASIEVLLMISSNAGSEEIDVFQRKNRLSVEIRPFKLSMKDSTDEGGLRRTYINYEGELEESENKKEQAKELILGILESEGRNTNQILDLTKKQVGSKNSREALNELVKDKLIKVARQGKQNYYSIINENKEQLEEGGG